MCGWVQRSMTSSFEWTSLDWLFFVKDPFRKYLWQLFRWFSHDSQWNMTLQSSTFAGRMGESQWGSQQVIFCFIFVLSYLHLHTNVVSDLELDLWCLHAVSVMQFIIFIDSADHLQLRMGLLYKDKQLMHLDFRRQTHKFALKSSVTWS